MTGVSHVFPQAAAPVRVFSRGTRRISGSLSCGSREGRDLGVAFQAPPGSQASSRGKPRTPLSSRVATRVSWSPLSGLKGVQPPLSFGERTRDSSPGHAGKEGPQLARTGAFQGFPRAAAPVGVFSRGTTRISGSLSCGTRDVRSPCAWRGGAWHGSRVMVGESRLKTF